MTTDEGFREIQLNGKQLVFLFMAATVVSVVIFLMGVLVGRGVRADRTPPAETSTATVAPDPVAARPAPATVAVQAPPAEPPPPAEELTYYDRLQKNNTPPETLKASTPAKPVVTQPPPQPQSQPRPASPQPQQQQQKKPPEQQKKPPEQQQ